MADVFFTMNGNVRAIGSIRRGANGQPQSLEAAIPEGDTAGIHIAGSGSVPFFWRGYAREEFLTRRLLCTAPPRLGGMGGLSHRSIPPAVWTL